MVALMSVSTTDGPFRGAARSGVLGVLVALLGACLPKCPLCVPLYAALFSGLGIELFTGHQAVRCILGAAALCAGALLACRAWRMGRIALAIVSILGAALTSAGVFAAVQAWVWSGGGTFYFAAAWSQMRAQRT
jgi:chromate transport protein ChrA